MARSDLHVKRLGNFPASRRQRDSGPILKGVKLLRKLFLVGACILVGGAMEFTAGQAPRHGVPMAGGAGHASGPRVIPAAPPIGVMPQPQFVRGPHLVGAGARGFGFGRPMSVIGRRVFFGAPLFRFRAGWRFRPTWLPTCVTSLGWAWGWGLDCAGAPVYGYTFENYLTPPVYEIPVYFYGGAERNLIWLYLKSGKVHEATDYWFVNGEMHFTIIEEDATRPVEHVVPSDELDVQKTTYVNTRRGFRMVFRDEPWAQYLKDHPDLTPPELPAPQ